MEIVTCLYYSIPIIIALHLIKTYFCRKSLKLPPSPATCLPIIGHLHILGKPIHITLTNLANRYGPIFLLRLGSRRVLLITSPSLAEECLNQNDVVFCNRPSGLLAAKHLAFNYTNLIWSPYGPHWRNLRRISTVEIFSSHRLKLLAPIRSNEVKHMIQRMYKLSKSSSSILEPKQIMYEVAMNVITKIIFGKRYYGVEGEESKKFRDMMATLLRLFKEPCIGDVIPFLRWLDWSKKRSFRKFDNERGMFLKGLLEDHREKMKLIDDKDKVSKVEKPLIQVLLGLQNSEPECYKDEVIFGLMMDLLIGSSDTSEKTMEKALSLLLNHPEVLNKAKAEIHNHVGYERLVEESDLNHFPYLHCIINETLRMYPPAPFLVPHASSEDCTVGGYHIPRGTMLQINVWAIQNDPKIWDDPTSFRPKRFEGVEGHKIGYKMMPFGSGRRSCPGEALATRVIGLTIGSIIQCFDLGRIGDDLVDMNIAAGPLQAVVRPCQAMIEVLDQM